MLTIFEFGVLLFDSFCLSPKCNLSETFTGYEHYVGEVEDNHRQTRSCLLNRCAENQSV